MAAGREVAGTATFDSAVPAGVLQCQAYLSLLTERQAIFTLLTVHKVFVINGAQMSHVTRVNIYHCSYKSPMKALGRSPCCISICHIATDKMKTMLRGSMQ